MHFYIYVLFTQHCNPLPSVELPMQTFLSAHKSSSTSLLGLVDPKPTHHPDLNLIYLWSKAFDWWSKLWLVCVCVCTWLLFVCAAALALFLWHQQLLQQHLNPCGHRRNHVPLQQLSTMKISWLKIMDCSLGYFWHRLLNERITFSASLAFGLLLCR